MYNTISDVLLYFINKYPYPDELSKTRITKMVYLADLYKTQVIGEQLTEIKWYFDHYGPYVSDVYDAAKKDNRISFENTFSAFGHPKTVIRKNNTQEDLEYLYLEEEDKKILDQVIEETKYLNWTDFIDFVYNTKPIITNDKYNYLDLKSEN
ncbi:Panacea domain-containing protein [Salisediminibacterium selenitireducens]|uniref:Antitoxin SocA-like Panacea domain-containing protein n=1 Tax=Bacillus selenitireducens (strain ATCC 700615 / DSM 15326 / MLS10) TaxID=439292 RepID=D6XZD8_BACIE|nr:Panacea domain-containing protein [Salisediminibacterium selenitireducens]ADH98312.1 conserved hypothetical protein [[Bacillus] selenitireducens MLS10]